MGVRVYDDPVLLRSRRGWLDRLSELLAQEALPIVVGAVCVMLLALLSAELVGQDSWLAFADGRLVAQHWLPHTDTLTAWSYGRPWIDQQWGAQLVLYWLAAHGGVGLASGLVILGVAATLALCGAASRSLGGSARSTAVALMLPVLAVPWLAQVRSQSLALVLFAGVYVLLAWSSRRPGRRVLLVLPLLVVWANVHGSVVLGAGLVLVHALWLVGRRGHRLTGCVLSLGAPLCLFASPYGLHLAGYYRTMLVQPPFAAYIPEWRPATFGVATAIFFASAFGCAVLWGSHRARLTGFEQAALPILLLGALQATRNAVWFELALAVALPRLLDGAWPSRIELTPSVRRLNVVMAATATALAAVTLVVQLVHLPAALDRQYPPAAAAAVAAAAGPRGTVLADERHADWLLWAQPSLSGRIAYDVRFELLTRDEIEQIVALRAGLRSAWGKCNANARVVTFETRRELRNAQREHVLDRATRVLADTPQLIAISRPNTVARSCNG